MKFLVVLASLVVLSNAVDTSFKEDIMKRMQEYGTKCIEEVHASDDDVAELLSHKIPPTSHEAKCLIFCLHKSFNMMTEVGTVDKEGTFKLLDPVKDTDPDLYDKLGKIFEICTSSLKPDSDPCITSTAWAECGVREGKAAGLSADLFEM